MKKAVSKLAIHVLTCAFSAVAAQSLFAGSDEELPGAPHEATPLVEGEQEWYRLAGIYQYLQFDYLGSADAVTYTFEIENQFSFESFDVENRLILDYADYPATIEDFGGNPTRPPTTDTPFSCKAGAERSAPATELTI